MSDWTTPPATESLEWEYISRQVTAAIVASMEFDGISSDYRRFQLEIYVQRTATGLQTTVSLKFNDDSALIYMRMSSEYEGGQIDSNSFDASSLALTSMGQSTPAGVAGASWAFIQKPAATLAATYECFVVEPSTAAAANCDMRILSGRWENTSDFISKMSFTGQNIGPGSRFFLAGARESL